MAFSTSLNTSSSWLFTFSLLRSFVSLLPFSLLSLVFYSAVISFLLVFIPCPNTSSSPFQFLLFLFSSPYPFPCYSNAFLSYISLISFSCLLFLLCYISPHGPFNYLSPFTFYLVIFSSPSHFLLFSPGLISFCSHLINGHGGFWEYRERGGMSTLWYFLSHHFSICLYYFKMWYL